MSPGLCLFAIQSSWILLSMWTRNLCCASFQHRVNLSLTLTNAGAHCVSVALFSFGIFRLPGLRMRWHGGILAVALGVLAGLQSRTEAKVLFSTSPASPNNLLQEGFLIGNGRLGGMFLESWLLGFDAKELQRFPLGNRRWRS